MTILNVIVHHYVVAIVLVLLAFLVAASTAVLEAWVEVRNKPKEEMFWCNKHGYFRKKHCLPLFPELAGKAENSFVCPVCYKNVVFDSPDRKLYGR